MLATFIADVYKEDEKQSIAEALDDVCSAGSTAGWSTAGVYSFWDPDSKEILYIGLAAELSQRFKHHNGMLPCPDNARKFREITNYFAKSKYLGYSVIVQSALLQPFNAAYYRLHPGDVDSDMAEFSQIDEDARREIAFWEGLLIEAHRKSSKWPAWNHRSGAKKGQARANLHSGILLDYLTTKNTGPLLARSSLREISSNATYYTYEDMILHPLRMLMLTTGMSFENAIEVQFGLGGQFSDMYRERLAEMEKLGYLTKLPDLSGDAPSGAD